MSADSNLDCLTSLPDRILLQVVVNIPFSWKDIFHCLRLNKRISNLVSKSQEWILSQILQNQFPAYVGDHIEATPQYMRFVVKCQDESISRHDIHPVTVSLELRPVESTGPSRSIRVLPISRSGCTQALISHNCVSQWPERHALGYFTQVLESGRGGRFPVTDSGVFLQLSARSRQRKCSALVLHTKADEEYQTRCFFDHCEMAAPFSRRQWWRIITTMATCTVAQQKQVVGDIVEKWLKSTRLREVGRKQHCWSFGLECYIKRTRIAVCPVLEGFCRQAFVSAEVVEKCGLSCHQLESVTRLKTRRGVTHQTQEAVVLRLSLGQCHILPELSANVVPASALEPFQLVAPLSVLKGLFRRSSVAESWPPVLVMGSAVEDTDSNSSNKCDPLSWRKNLPARYKLQETDLVGESEHLPVFQDEWSRKRSADSSMRQDFDPKSSATRLKHARLSMPKIC